MWGSGRPGAAQKQEYMTSAKRSSARAAGPCCTNTVTGASKNWLRAEALAAGDPELIELSEDLSSALQLTDQYVYDNNFIYFQPGNGK